MNHSIKLIATLIVLAAVLFAFQMPGKKKVILTCEITNASPSDSLFLYEFNAISFELLDGVGTADGTNFVFELPLSKPRFYYVGTKDQRVKSVLIGAEPKVLLKGDMKRMRQAKVAEGDNAVYNAMISDSRRLRNEQITLAQEFRKVYNDEEQRNTVIQQMKATDDKKRALLKETKTKNPFVAKILGLYTFYSFQNNNTKNYPNELSYFANEYLAQADLQDEDLAHAPMVYDAFNSFTTMLCKTKQFPEAELDKVLTNALTKVDDTSGAYRYALGGIAGGLRSQNNPLFIAYGNRFIEKYKKDKSSSMKDFIKKVEIAKGFLPGAVAPDFTQNTPEGKPVSLSDYRGKVVLVDFWASWCGPCRKENPHVVQLYEKYKDKGFDVLGVSLDKDRSRWVGAIEKDGLEWTHISDLKGWKNEVAQMYSVSSIPHTILMDEEGHILGRKLRSHEIEAKLKEIFGE